MSSARLWKRALALALMGTLLAAVPPVHAGDADFEAAEAAAERFSERLDLEIAHAKLAAEMARVAKSRMPGVIVTPKAVLFVDGAEVPIEWMEWVDPVQARRIRRAARTDTVLRVGPGFTLSLENLAGDIRVVTWDRNEVRIEAEHDRSDELVTELKNSRIRLGVGSKKRSPAEVEWKLTVPAWLPLEIAGFESEIKLTGMRSSVRAQSMRGDVIVVGCQGPVEANSVEGEVHMTDVSGNVTASSVNNVVKLLRVVGPVEAQTINGDIQLEKVESVDVDASTVNGRVYFASGYRPRGRYVFTSHNGRLIVPVPKKNQDINVTVASYQGQLESSMSIPTPAPRAKGRSMKFVIRDGVATRSAPMFSLPSTPRPPRSPRAPRTPRAPQPGYAPPAPPELELESFGGLIRLASQEDVLKLLTKQRAMLDNLRSQRSHARWKYEAARQIARDQAHQDRREAPTPTPPPIPDPPPQD